MWKETKVVKNVSQYNFDARYGAYATNESDGSSVIYIAGKEFHTRKATRVRVPVTALPILFSSLLPSHKDD